MDGRGAVQDGCAHGGWWSERGAQDGAARWRHEAAGLTWRAGMVTATSGVNQAGFFWRSELRGVGWSSG
jgi:hypothetical protein